MGEIIENRVVEMAFDNTKFEKGIQSTLNLLGRLNNAITGLNTIKYNILGVADQVKAVTFDPINTQLQIGVGKAMALTAALTGVYNITDQIYNTMVRTVRAMTFDNIDAGYSRYEQVVNSTQVLLASAREEGEAVEDTMERVSAIQDKLLWFADETSYDAMAMLDTISKFTSHGFDLETAATAMEGIANWAATAGVNATNATHAMEQLAQTIGKGYVGSQDWISIQGLNMDTTKFKELVIDSAVARGELKKFGNEVRTLDGTMDVTAFNMEKSFSKKWFTKDVLNDVLKKYGEANEIIRKVQAEMGEGTLVSEAIEEVKSRAEYAQYMLSIEAFEMAQVARTWSDAFGSIQTAVATKISGIFQVVFGDYLEAKDLWTDVSEKLYEIFVEPLNLVLDAFKKWGDKNGFNGSERFWNSMKIIYNSISKTMSQLWEIVSRIFGKQTIEDGEKVYSITEMLYSLLESITRKITFTSNVFSRFMHNLRDNEKVWKNVESFLNGIKIGFDLVSDAVSKFTTKVIEPLSGRAGETIESFSGLGLTFERLMQDLKGVADESDIFNRVFDDVYKVLDKVITLFNDFIDKFNHFAGTLYYMNTDKEGNGGYFTGLLKSAEEAEGPLEKIFSIITKGLDDISFAMDVFSPFMEDMTGLLMTVLDGIGEIAESLAPSVKMLFDALAGFISENTKDFDFVKFMDAISTGILHFVENVGKNAVDVIIYALSSIRLEIAEWLKMFTGKTNIEDIVKSSMGLIIAVIFIFSTLSDIVEYFQSMKWDGIFGKMLWGDTLTNLTDQLYYKALAATFTAVADGILAIAAALFIISLIDTTKMESSLDALYHITTIMLIITGVVETLNVVLDKFTDSEIGALKGGSALEKIFNGLGSIGDMFAYQFKMEATAKIISSVTWGFLKLAAAMWMLSKIPNVNEVLPVMWSLAGIMLVLFMVCALLTGGSINSSNLSSVKGAGGLSKILSNKKFNLSKESSSILAGAAALLIITMALGRVAKTLKALSAIPENDLLSAATSLTQMIVVITVFMGLITVMTKWLDQGDTDTSIIKVGRVISMMSWALLVIAGSLLALTKLGDMSKMPEAAKWLGIAFAGFSAIIVGMVALTKLVDEKQLAAMAPITSAMVVMIFALLGVTGALAILSNMPLDGLETASKALGAIIISLAAIVWTMSKITNAKSAVAIAGSLALILVSLLALVPLLNTLKDIDSGVSVSLIAISAGLALLIVALGGVGKFISDYPAAIGGMFAIAGAISLLGIAGLAASAGIYLIAEAFKILTESFASLKDLDAEKIRDNFITLSEAIPVIMKAIGEGIKQGFDAMFSGDSSYFGTLAINILNGFMDAIFAILPRLMAAVLVFVPQLILDTINILNRVLPSLLDFLNDFGVLLTVEVTAGTIRIIVAVVRGIIEGIIEFIPELTETLNKVTDAILEHGEEFIEAVKRLSGPLTHLVNEIIDPILDMVEPFRKIIYRMMEFVLDVVNDFGVLLTEKVTAGTIRISLAVLSGFIEGLTEGIPEFLSNVAELIIQFINDIADIIDRYGDPLIDAIDNLMDSISKFVWKIVVHWGEEGSAFFEGGVQIVAGLTRGITSRLRMVKESAFSLGEYVKNGFCKVLRIESPSKVFEKFGQYIPDGLINGVEDKKQAVFDLFSNFATKIKESFGTNFGGLQDTLSGLLSGLNLSPEITPILNLSNVEGGLSSLTSMFNGQNLTGSLNLSNIKDLTNVLGQQQLSGMIGVDGFNMGDISLGNDAVSLNNGIGDLNTKMDKLISIETFNAEKTTETNVIFESNTKNLFKSVRTENTKRARATGYNQLAGMKV